MTNNIVQDVRKLFRSSGFEVREGAGFCELLGSIDAGGVLVETLTQAAANKAAEEGGLPYGDALDTIAANAAREVGGIFTDAIPIKSLVVYARAVAKQAIAADRASRQVANKADGEPSDSYKAGYADGMEEGAKLAFWGDKPSEKFPEGWPAEIWLNAGDDELGPFSEYDEVSWCSAPQGESDIRYIREDLLATPPATTGASTALADMEARKDAAYYERNQVVAALAKCFPSGVAKTAIEGWSEDWHGCVYIDLPTGQASWHFHDSHAHLFDGLPAYVGGWDGHSTDEKYARLAALKPVGASTVLTDERIATIDTPDFVSLLLAWETDKLGTSDRSKEFYALTAHIDRHVAREVAAQAGQVAAPTDMTAAAAFIDKRAEQYLQDHADNENDTGAVVFHFGEAGREYHSVLVELAEDLRQASKPAACTVPPAGWNCTRTAGHEGPCAATPSPAKESK